MRLRCGELPCCLVTVKPMPGSSSARSFACSENAERPTRFASGDSNKFGSVLEASQGDLLRYGRVHGHSLRPTASCGRQRGDGPERHGHSWSPCGRGSHAGGCGRDCSAGKCVSTYDLTTPARGSLILLTRAKCNWHAGQALLKSPRQISGGVYGIGPRKSTRPGCVRSAFIGRISTLACPSPLLPGSDPVLMRQNRGLGPHQQHRGRDWPIS